ncbi:F0F1 ATP synthase subunit delta [Kingella kingae]|uniref:F0F1 ATP synthase subunit delta n=1 Tax=Kingella kingae TaxID=504 RepID=UPI00254C2A2D|nr:F0F1 ATP synthase subunit delta [Kingella kingae]MDK4528119.1 F0F1 ATP synthase subunit delta [Kingella kingae]MDK4542116.1 F0F1 ATP synthase subunit delta [Kingella kingae]MDK4561710.1 F0F1 ATP synthase subunit delta [Kingella kingae]MDK4601899.1 F0F1 ATP synthase subunit delta [Kingella kingae]MDK4631914.1 F0F1 ATP synthase subunit delta [Kingella kingae]
MIEFATVARPYAKALFELAEEKAQTENWLNGLAQLAWLVEQPKIAMLIGESSSDAEQKAAELTRLLDGVEAAKSHEFRNFILVVAQEKRLAALPAIFRSFQDLVLQKNQAKRAVIYTAYDVASEGQKAKIVGDLEQRFNVRLQAAFETEPELIGGLKVVLGDQILDLSVQGKLKQLYATMTN